MPGKPGTGRGTGSAAKLGPCTAWPEGAAGGGGGMLKPALGAVWPAVAAVAAMLSAPAGKPAETRESAANLIRPT